MSARLCDVCPDPIPAGARADARTCGRSACRKRLQRARTAACEAVAAELAGVDLPMPAAAIAVLDAGCRRRAEQLEAEAVELIDDANRRIERCKAEIKAAESKKRLGYERRAKARKIAAEVDAGTAWRRVPEHFENDKIERAALAERRRRQRAQAIRRYRYDDDIDDEGDEEEGDEDGGGCDHRFDVPDQIGGQCVKCGAINVDGYGNTDRDPPDEGDDDDDSDEGPAWINPQGDRIAVDGIIARCHRCDIEWSIAVDGSICPGCQRAIPDVRAGHTAGGAR